MFQLKIYKDPDSGNVVDQTKKDLSNSYQSLVGHFNEKESPNILQDKMKNQVIVHDTSTNEIKYENMDS